MLEVKHRIARAKLNMNDPCHKFIQNSDSIQSHVSKMFPNVIPINVPYIQTYPFHGSNNLYDNDSVDLLIFKTNVSLQKLFISYDQMGGKMIRLLT